MTYVLWSEALVIRIPDAWTVFTIDGTRCQRNQTGELVTFVGERWRVVDTNPLRIGHALEAVSAEDVA